jgi:hypothetical protein
VRTHVAHDVVVRWWGGRDAALCGHALAETYSVLTRLPRGLRLEPGDAAHLLRERFGAPLLVRAEDEARLPETFARLGIAGGAVYDGLVALAAVAHDVELATRDARARPTYEALGARVTAVG